MKQFEATLTAKQKEELEEKLKTLRKAVDERLEMLNELK